MSFPLMEGLTEDPRSQSRFKISGVQFSVSGAGQSLMSFLESMLANPAGSDEEGARRVISAARDGVIGDEAQAEHSDMPMIMKYCLVHQEEFPLTCICLLSYGHTKSWTHAVMPQYLEPMFDRLAERVEPTPMIARAVIEFTAAENGFTDWMGDDSYRALSRLACANSVLRRAKAVEEDSLDDANAQLSGLIKSFSEKHGPLSKRLMNRIESAVNKLPDAAGKPFNSKELKDAEQMMDMIADHADLIWPFPENISPGDFITNALTFLELNRRNRKSAMYACRALDDEHTCQWILRALTCQAGALDVRFSCQSTVFNGQIPGLMMDFLDKAEQCVADNQLKIQARVSLTAGLAGWIGLQNYKTIKIEDHLRNRLLDQAFKPELIDLVSERLSSVGARVFASFVMSGHRYLAKHLNRADRGRYLEEELGM